jgi:hypothetical protein
MSELSPEARALVARERERGGPTPADRARVRARLEPAWAARAGQAAAGAGSATAGRLGIRLSRILLSTALLSFSFLSGEAPVPAPADRELSRAAQPTAAESRAGLAGTTASTALARLADGTSDSTAERAAGADSPRPPLEGAARDGRGEAERRPLHATRGASAKSNPVAPRRPPPANARHASTTVPDEPAASARQRQASSASETAPGTAEAATTDLPAASAQERDRAAELRATHAAQTAVRRPRRVATSMAAGAAGQSTSDALSGAPDVSAQAFVPEAIDDELSWLGAAQEALRRHEPTRALQLVQEHAFRFPRGILAQERRAVQALALCALQRKQAARAVLHELEQRAPSSPLVAGIRRTCGL